MTVITPLATLVVPFHSALHSLLPTGTPIDIDVVCTADAWTSAPSKDADVDLRLRGHVFASSDTMTTVSIGGLLCDLPLLKARENTTCRIDVTIL